MRVFLIGMPGVGKSHWGRIWSEANDFRFYDLDAMIEAAAGLTIPSIIENAGEPAFRQLESRVLCDAVAASSAEKAIISCGGGTPTFPENLRLMLDSGCVVYLQAPLDIILNQLRSSAVQRPLLQQMSIESLDSLFKKRKFYYEQAHIRVTLGNAGAGTFAEILEACSNRHS